MRESLEGALLFYKNIASIGKTNSFCAIMNEVLLNK